MNYEIGLNYLFALFTSPCFPHLMFGMGRNEGFLSLEAKRTLKIGNDELLTMTCVGFAPKNGFM